MASRVPWSFNGYSWHVNPDSSTWFTDEEIYAENTPINATSSSLQWGGRKSGRCKISGTLIGPSAETQKANFESWKHNRTKSYLVDHNGNSQRAVLVSLNFEEIIDIAAFKCGKSTWKYDAEFVAV